MSDYDSVDRDSPLSGSTVDMMWGNTETIEVTNELTIYLDVVRFLYREVADSD